jgi:hypothetical protein
MPTRTFVAGVEITTFCGFPQTTLGSPRREAVPSKLHPCGSSIRTGTC